MLRCRRQAERILATGLCGALAVFSHMVRAQEPLRSASDSPAKAEALLDTSGWHLLDYAWQGQNTLLTIRGTARTPQAVLVNVETKQETPLKALDKLFAEASSAASEKIGWELSPDRASLLWIENRREGAVFRVASLDGSRTTSWERGAGSEPIRSTEQPWWAWRQDSKGWVEATRLLYTPPDTAKWDSVQAGDGTLHARFFMLETPAKVLDIVPSRSKFHPVQIPRTAVVGFNAQGRLELLEWPNDAHPTGYRLVDYDALHHIAPVRGFTAVLPPDCTPTNLTISPSGLQVAWLLARHAPERTELWITDWMGKSAQMYESRPVAQGGQMELSEPRWTPDGKHVTYLYHNILYTVKAPPPPPRMTGYGS